MVLEKTPVSVVHFISCKNLFLLRQMAQIFIQMKTEKWKIKIQTSVRHCSLAFFGEK